jgi:hypothetical protein
MVIIYPLGNSDIQTKSGTINAREFREKTEEVWNWIKNNKDKVTPSNLKLNNQNDGEKKEIKGISLKRNGNGESYYFPILSEVFNEFISKEKGDNNVIYFIYTDQKDEKVNKQDTIYEFEIIRFFLKELIKSNWAVEPLPFEGDPTDIKNALENIDKFKKIVLNKKDLLKQGDIEIIYGPGVPAVNYSLILRFFDVANFHYAKLVRIGESQTTEITTTPILGVISPIVSKNAIKGLIANYNYIAAYNFLSVFEKLQPMNEDLSKTNLFLEVIYYYMLFRFNEAKNSLSTVNRKHYLNGKEENELYELLKSELEPLTKYNPDEVEFLVPLINIMQIYFKSGMFNDWISLVFRLDEEFGKLITEILLGGIKIEKDDSGKFKALEEAIEGNKELKEYLNEHSIRYDKPTRKTYEVIINYFKDKQNLDDKKRHIIDSYDKLGDFLGETNQNKDKKLSDLRNNSPFAHGFVGISEDLINEHAQMLPEAVLAELIRLSRDLVENISENMKGKVKDINSKEFVFNKINKLLTEAYLE